MSRLRNYTEEVVKQHVDKWLPQMGVCCCEDCRLDVMAIMLNRLKPHYVVSDKGQLYAQLTEFNKQNKADIISALSASVELVKKKPRHVIEGADNVKKLDENDDIEIKVVVDED